MSGSNRAKIAHRRKRYTGEPYQHISDDMQLWRAGHPVIPLAADDAQQRIESAVLHRLLLGARAQRPVGTTMQHPLFISRIYLSKSAPRIEIPVGAGLAFGSALAAQQGSSKGWPLADGIVVRRLPAGSSLLVVEHSAGGQAGSTSAVTGRIFAGRWRLMRSSRKPPGTPCVSKDTRIGSRRMNGQP